MASGAYDLHMGALVQKIIKELNEAKGIAATLSEELMRRGT